MSLQLRDKVLTSSFRHFGRSVEDFSEVSTMKLVFCGFCCLILFMVAVVVGEDPSKLFARDMDHIHMILQRWVPCTVTNMGGCARDPETFFTKMKINFHSAIKYLFDPILSKIAVSEEDAGR